MPHGKPRLGGKPDKLIRDALILELHQEHAGTDGKATKIIRLLARRLIRSGLEGDINAIKEIADRVDGKPPVSVQHAGEGGGPMKVEFITIHEAKKEKP